MSKKIQEIIELIKKNECQQSIIKINTLSNIDDLEKVLIEACSYGILPIAQLVLNKNPKSVSFQAFKWSINMGHIDISLLLLFYILNGNTHLNIEKFKQDFIQLRHNQTYLKVKEHIETNKKIILPINLTFNLQEPASQIASINLTTNKPLEKLTHPISDTINKKSKSYKEGPLPELINLLEKKQNELFKKRLSNITINEKRQLLLEAIAFNNIECVSWLINNNQNLITTKTFSWSINFGLNDICKLLLEKLYQEKAIQGLNEIKQSLYLFRNNNTKTYIIKLLEQYGTNTLFYSYPDSNLIKKLSL